MDIHVVQKEDNIYTIAEQYGVSSERLLIDNDLTAPGNLVVGQALVIVYPQKTYQVQPKRYPAKYCSCQSYHCYAAAEK